MPPVRTLGAEEKRGQKSAEKHHPSDLVKGRVMERNVNLRENAKNLRKNMTKEEAHLWYQFLCRYPQRFRRQYIIGNYIVDFYCHQAKLVVELDGSQHCESENMEYDKKRTEYLRSQGLEVLRFSNLDIMRQFRSICEAIDIAVKRKIGCEQA